MKIFATLACLASLLAHADQLQAASLKVFKGTEGQRVDLVRLAPAGDGISLMRVRVSGSPFDGLVLRCEVDDTTGKIRGRFHGALVTLAQIADGSGTVFFPEGAQFTVTFSEADTAKAVAREVTGQHLKQLADGRLASFAKKQYPHLTQKYEAKAMEALINLKKACPKVSSFTFDWSSFSDEDMDNFDVWNICQAVVPHTAKECSKSLRSVSKIVCRMGTEPSVDSQGSTLTFTTSPGGMLSAPPKASMPVPMSRSELNKMTTGKH